MVVPPAGAGEQHVQRRHRCAPRQLLRVLQPLDVLDGHRRRHHRERLVGREDPVPPAEEVPLEPTRAEVLGQHLHDPAVGGELLVVGRAPAPGEQRSVASNTACSRLLAVSSGQNSRNVPPPSSVTSAAYTSRISSPIGRVLSWVVTARRTSERVGLQVLDRQLLEQPAAVGERRGRHPLVALRSQRPQLLDQPPALVEQLVGPVLLQPLLEDLQVRRVSLDPRQRDLVAEVGVLDLDAVDLVRPGPTLGGAQHDGRPAVPDLLAGLTAAGRARAAPRSARGCGRAPPRGRGTPARGSLPSTTTGSQPWLSR